MKLTKETRDEIQIGDILKDNWCEFEITNITNSGRFNNGKTLSLKFIRCNDERMIGRISRGNPMSELYGMEIIKK